MTDQEVPVTEASINIMVEEVAHHRNGVGGTPFYVITFKFKEQTTHAMVAVVYDRPGHVAVFNRQMLGRGIIAFGAHDGTHNSWRGDVFEPALRKVIKRWEDLREGQVH